MATTWKLEIEYDGTRYRGWQKQINARTVQGEIEKAAEEFFDTGLFEVGGSGRTDAGVHALEQIAHLRVFRPVEDFTPKILQYELNSRLPHDINVLRVRNATENFHARHNAIARSYLYQISPRRTAFAKNYVWWVKDRLDVSVMNRACSMIVGKHDFYSFCERDESEKSTLVVVEKAECFTVGDMIVFRFGASHFLWKMVRRLVGTIAEVGRGKMSLKEFESLLHTKSRITAPLTAPPSGLFLEKVCYVGEEIPFEHKPANLIG